MQVRSVFFLIFILLQNTATWDEVQSTGLNFCCLMVPVRKAHLAYEGYKYWPKTVFFTFIEFWTSVYIKPSEMCLH